MPKMNGVELLVAVKKELPDVPFIILSAHLEKDMMMMALDLGTNAFIEKPFREKDLIEKVNRILKI